MASSRPDTHSLENMVTISYVMNLIFREACSEELIENARFGNSLRGLRTLVSHFVDETPAVVSDINLVHSIMKTPRTSSWSGAYVLMMLVSFPFFLEHRNLVSILGIIMICLLH